MMLRFDIHHWFAMAAIFNQKWPPKYKNPPIWSNIMIHFVGLSTVVCDSFWGLKQFKMAAVAMVTKV
jgi:hypothetical protein